MKKITAFLLALCFALSLAACGGAPKDPYIDKDGVPSLGVGETDYEGFSYLYQERLTTESQKDEQTGKMVSRDVTIYLPEGDWNDVNRSRASSEGLGVSFQFELEPYMHRANDYTLAENLSNYLKDKYDPEYLYPSGEGLEIGEPTVNEDGKTAVARVSYFPYDKYDKVFTYQETTVALYELDDGTMALLTVTIAPEETTGKTPELIKELESFYRVAIDWDAVAAQTKLDEFLASEEAQMPAFGTSFMNFELPEGWDVTDKSDVFAPGGDIAFSGCALNVEREYVGASEAKSLQQIDLTELGAKAAIAELVGVPEENLLLEQAETPLGKGYYLEAELQEDGLTLSIKGYTIFSDDGYMYDINTLAVAEMPGASASAAEGLAMLLETAQLI